VIDTASSAAHESRVTFFVRAAGPKRAQSAETIVRFDALHMFDVSGKIGRDVNNLAYRVAALKGRKSDHRAPWVTRPAEPRRGPAEPRCTPPEQRAALALINAACCGSKPAMSGAALDDVLSGAGYSGAVTLRATARQLHAAVHLRRHGTKRALTRYVSHTGTPVLKLRRQRLLVGGTTFLVALGSALVLAVHHVPQAGPFIANSLRAIVGIEAVARLEELVASAEDSSMRMRWRGAPPRSLDSMSTPQAPEDTGVRQPRNDGNTAPAAYEYANASDDSPERTSPPPVPVFTPTAIHPPYPEVAAAGDGSWVPVQDPEHPEAPALLYKTLLHPDPDRAWSELFLVAMPSSLVQLSAVPGTAEPSSENPAAQTLAHRGLIPTDQHAQLLAAFNGGFRAEHGHHGMFVDGVLLVPPRADMCTIAGYESGALRIGTYSRLVAEAPKPLWFRQSPRCMVEQGVLHPGLRDDTARGWGSTLEGDTVIRRSSIALSENGDVLYVAVTNFTTARALAVGMRSAGGWNVAQLDVNFSFPKFLLFPRDGTGARHAVSLFQGFLFEADEMLDEATERDFFYVIRRQGDARTQLAPTALSNQRG
jgi:hypothetical protein